MGFKTVNYFADGNGSRIQIKCLMVGIKKRRIYGLICELYLEKDFRKAECFFFNFGFLLSVL